MKIQFFYDEVKYRLKKVREIKNLIIRVIRDEEKIPGDLNFIITTDKRILEINREFLKHDYFTDVIAFGYGTEKFISGEIYVSLDTVKRNATNYTVSFNSEILRVMIHGTLHLCGYIDNCKNEMRRMREKEDQWLRIFYGQGVNGITL